jgi:valyl-tRNA synthetase
MSSGQDVRFSEDKVAQGQQLTNKLWNASRLILLGVGADARAAVPPASAPVEDRWIVSRLEAARAEVARRIEQYDFSHAALALYDFIYASLCDWYLELVKPRLRDREPEAASTLLHVLTETLTIAHPIIPFVTEEIWTYVPGASGLLAARTSTERGSVDTGAELALARMIEAVQAVRTWRDKAGVKAGAQLAARIVADGYDATAPQLARLARLSLDGASGEPVAAVPVDGGAIELFAGEGFDAGAVDRRRAEQRARLESEIVRAEAKLRNEGFIAKAPANVVAGEREKLARLKAELEAL